MGNAQFSLEETARALAALGGFWDHWGFEPWSEGAFAGVARRQRFVKGGLLGPIAEYRAWDYIVWRPGSEEDRERLWRNARPVSGVMTQRYLFLVEAPWPKRRIRSFLLGLRGYVEFHARRPGREDGTGRGAAKDLTDLVDMGLRLYSREKGEEAARQDRVRGAGAA